MEIIIIGASYFLFFFYSKSILNIINGTYTRENRNVIPTWVLIALLVFVFNVGTIGGWIGLVIGGAIGYSMNDEVE